MKATELLELFYKIRNGEADAISDLINSTHTTVVGRIFSLFWHSGFKNRWSESDFISKVFIEDTLSFVYSETVLNIIKICDSTDAVKYFWGIVRNIIRDRLKERSRQLNLFTSVERENNDTTVSSVGLFGSRNNDLRRSVKAKLLLGKIADIIEGLNNPLKKDILLLKMQGYLPREMLEILADLYGEQDFNAQNIYTKIRWAMDNLLKNLSDDDKEFFDKI
jgi:hypothetical protein